MRVYTCELKWLLAHCPHTYIHTFCCWTLADSSNVPVCLTVEMYCLLAIGSWYVKRLGLVGWPLAKTSFKFTSTLYRLTTCVVYQFPKESTCLFCSWHLGCGLTTIFGAHCTRFLSITAVVFYLIITLPY